MDFETKNSKQGPPPEVESHNLVQMDSVHFGEAIKNDFGIALTGIEKIVKGYQSQVYKAANPEGKTVFIKINKKKEELEVEISGYGAFREAGIPVPKVIAYQENPSTIRQPTLIISAAEGVALSEAKLSSGQEETIYRNIGEILKKINDIKIEGFGYLKVVDGKLEGKFKNYGEFCKEWGIKIIEAFDYLVENSLITSEESKKLRNIFEEISSLNLKQSFLLHRDMHQEHVFIDGDKISGIIDFGKLQAGDPRYDIAESLMFQNERQQSCFKKGYGEVADDPMVLKYLAIIATTKIRFRTKMGKKEDADTAAQILRDTLSKI
jgi:aminoglycoside phosphotransferase